MAPIPTATLNAGDSTPKLPKASLILATEAINELYSFMDPDSDSSVIAFTRNMSITGTLNVSGAITGNASTATLAASATKLVTARTISMTGDGTWTSGNFDGTANVSAAMTLVAVGTPVSNALVKITTDTKGRVTATSAATASDVQSLVDSVYVAKSGSVMSGNLTITNAGPTMVLNSSGTGQGRYQTFQTAGSNRWVSGVSSAAESGSNAGSNYFVQRYDDNGNVIDVPLNINRATGLTTLNALTVGGALTTNAFTVTAGVPAVVINTNVSSANGLLEYQNVGLMRWAILKTSTAESGGNVGSDLSINRYDDSGAFIDTPFTLTRSTAVSTFRGQVIHTGTNNIGMGTTTPGTTAAGGLIAGTAATVALEAYRSAATSQINTLSDGSYAVFHAISATATNTISGRMRMTRSRGTLAAPTAVASGDLLGAMEFMAYDGSSAILGAGIGSWVDTYTAAGNYSTLLSFATKTDGAGAVGTEKMRLDKNGFLLLSDSSYFAGITTGGNINGLQLAGSGSVVNIGQIRYTTTQASSPVLGHAKVANNTAGTFTAVSTGDVLGTYRVSGGDGSALTEAISIQSVVNGTVAAGSVPADLIFSFQTVQKMRISAAGNLGLNQQPDTNYRMVLTAGSGQNGLKITGGGTTPQLTTTDGNVVAYLGYSSGSGASALNYTGTGSAHAQAFITNNLERMRITSGGLVNIGAVLTNTPAPLVVGGSLAITQTSNNQYLLMGNQDSGGVNLPVVFQASNGSLEIGVGNSWTSATGGTLTPYITMLSSGSVGINTTTPGTTQTASAIQTGNSTLLELYRAGVSAVTTIGDSGSGLFLAATYSSTASTLSIFRGSKARGTMAAPTAVATGDSISTHQGSAYDGSAYQITSSLNHGVDTYNAATDVGGYLSLNTRPTGVGASLTERVRVTAAGSVGVGTTTPAASLEVMGSIASRNTKTVNTVANSRWFGGAYTGNLFTLAALDGANGNNNLQIGGGTAGGEPATQIQLFTGPAGALGVGTARMTISSTGLISDSSGNELGWKNIPPNTSGFVRNGCYCISANTAINAASAGDSYQLFNDTATSLSLTVGTGITTMRLSGTTSTGARTLLPYGKATIWFRAGDTPIVSGDVL